MKYIDIRKIKVNEQYIKAGIYDLYVYHSKKEFYDNVASKYPTITYIVNNLSDIFHYLKDVRGEKTYWNYITLTDHQVWIATGERYTPDIYNHVDDIVYKLTDQNELIKTDNCFIRLLAVRVVKNKLFLLFTSGGIHSVSLNNWRISAAVKQQFTRTQTETNQNYISADRYDERLERILNNKKVQARDLRLVHYLLNPLSDCFMNPEAAVKKTYGSSVRKPDRMKVIESDKIRSLILRELGGLMSDLQKAIQEGIPPQKVAGFLSEIAQNSINNENVSVEDKLMAVDAIIKIGYSEEYNQINNNTGGITSGVPLLGGKEETTLGGGEKQRQLSGGEQVMPVELYNDADMEKEDPKPKPTPEDEEKLKKQAMKELNIIPDYIDDNSV